MGKIKPLLIMMLLLLLAPSLVACDPAGIPSSPATEAGAVTPLPPPELESALSLDDTLKLRRSVREFKTTPLNLEEVGQLLWAAQGITNERGFRTAPSAGALYPLETYVVTADGVFRYEPDEHQLSVVVRGDVQSALYEAALRQDVVRRAPAVFVIAAVYERTEAKYGAERGPQYVHLEAGHAAQNLLLEAVALDLGAVPIGAFQDEEVQKAIGLPTDHEPLYLIPVGHPQRAGP